jgi:hypothetical protein
MSEVRNLYAAAKAIKNSYDASYQAANQQYLAETGNALEYRSDYWWRHQGFDWKKVKKNGTKFKAWLANIDSSIDVEAVYDSIVHRGESNTQGDFSLVGGKAWMPWSFSPASRDIANAQGFSEWSNDNMFETLNKSQNEIAKYAITTEYFGHGGWKLDKLFDDFKTEQEMAGIWSQDEINQAAFITKAIIDSSHGNFRRIKNPRWAAVNNYLTSWSILAGLPLSTIASLPETMMIYFKVKDNAEWQKANARLIQQIGGAWNEALAEEVEITRKQLEQSGLSEDINTVVDRLATGERDVSFVRVHEAFFRAVGIKQFTQFQRRMNAGFAIDTVKAGLNRLDFAPKNEDGTFNLQEFNEIEMRTYADLTDLGLNVYEIYNLVSELDEIYRDALFDITDNRPVDADLREYIKSPTQREMAARKIAREEGKRDLEVIQRASEIQQQVNEELQTVIYRFVNERIQNPQAANRPLVFQDPHYKIFTQFNGFISTFTANIIPKLWRDQVVKGNPKVKYDAFALIIMMMALGGASQYINLAHT